MNGEPDSAGRQGALYHLLLKGLVCLWVEKTSACFIVLDPNTSPSRRPLWLPSKLCGGKMVLVVEHETFTCTVSPSLLDYPQPRSVTNSVLYYEFGFRKTSNSPWYTAQGVRGPGPRVCGLTLGEQITTSALASFLVK